MEPTHEEKKTSWFDLDDKRKKEFEVCRIVFAAFKFLPRLSSRVADRWSLGGWRCPARGWFRAVQAPREVRRTGLSSNSYQIIVISVADIADRKKHKPGLSVTGLTRPGPAQSITTEMARVALLRGF